MDWLLSALSALMLWQMGDGSIWGPRIGLLNQVFWLVYAVQNKSWGLIPGVVLFVVVHARNHVKMSLRD